MAMFSNNSGKEPIKSTTELSNSNTHIAKGAIFAGNVETYGTIRLEGRVFGNIKSKGKVSLGETSYVHGNILAQNAEIAGEVSGTVEIADILTLKASALINGDILCNKLVVEVGANFNGKCQMGAVIQEIIINDNPLQLTNDISAKTQATQPLLSNETVQTNSTIENTKKTNGKKEDSNNPQTIK